jgi:hypothetical protein
MITSMDAGRLVRFSIERASPGASRHESSGPSVTEPSSVVTVTSPSTTT